MRRTATARAVAPPAARAGPSAGASAGRAHDLVSVAGLAGAPVTDAAGARVGRIVDVVAQWGTSLYPAVRGLVVRVGPRRVFVHAEQVLALTAAGARLGSMLVDLRDYARGPGEVLLAGDVIDHQLVDVDGVRVVRASDLYLTRTGERFRLVAVDVGMRPFLRRLAPAPWRRHAVPERVIDWADIAPFSRPGAAVRLRLPHDRLRELRPAALADMLADLGRTERHELLTTLPAETAADVLEEMAVGDVVSLLRDAVPAEAAELVGRMEPDEAVDALRALADDDRARILACMAEPAAARLLGLLAYPEDRAGGFMTTHLVVAHLDDTVGAVRDQLRERRPHWGDIDAVAVVDDDGRLVDDVPLFELLLSEDAATLGGLVGPPWPATVTSGAGVDAVVGTLVASRRSSVLVVDDGRRPIGRILADDVLDVIIVERGRHWPWQQG